LLDLNRVSPFGGAFGSEVHGAGSAEWLKALRLNAQAIVMAGSIEHKSV